MVLKNKFVVLRHFNYPGRKDRLDVILEGFGFSVTEETPLVKFEAADALNDIQFADYKGNARYSYLMYKGQMSGDRGDVTRVAQGIWYTDTEGNVIFETDTIRRKYRLVLRKITDCEGESHG